MPKLLTFSILIILLAQSCTPDYFFEEKRLITNSRWAYQDTLNFTVDIQDTSRIYNLFLDLEHSTDYSFQNIYLLIHTLFPGGERPQQLIPVDLADKTGNWQGDCNAEACELRINLQQDAFFNAIGLHTFTIEQYMRKDSLSGIHSIALRIQDTGKSRAN